MIYVLLLEHEKWYIGYTERENGERFLEHFKIEGAKYPGAKWTQLHNPLQVMEFRKGTKDDENELTITYMKKYGWWNVRGGIYCQVEMTTPPKCLIPNLPKEIHTATKPVIPILPQQKTKPVIPILPQQTTKSVIPVLSQQTTKCINNTIPVLSQPTTKSVIPTLQQQASKFIIPVLQQQTSKDNEQKKVICKTTETKSVNIYKQKESKSVKNNMCKPKPTEIASLNIESKSSRSGKKWTDEEHNKLLKIAETKITFEEMAIIFERTPGAIKSRLLHLCRDLIHSKNITAEELSLKYNLSIEEIKNYKCKT